MSTEPQEFLEYVVKSLVDHPGDVVITKTVDEMGVLMTLDLNPEDMGKIIGRKGATAKAIRTLLRVVGMRGNARVNLKINEPQGGSMAHVSEEAAAMGQIDGMNQAPETAAPIAAAEASDVDAAIADLKGDFS